MRELFVKTNFQDIGEKEGGISWERDPVKHRAVAKKLHAVFSARALKAQEPTLQEHIDRFVSRLRAYGGGEKGLELKVVRNSLLSSEGGLVTFGITSGWIGSRWIFPPTWLTIASCTKSETVSSVLSAAVKP